MKKIVLVLFIVCSLSTMYPCGLKDMFIETSVELKHLHKTLKKKNRKSAHYVRDAWHKKMLLECCNIIEYFELCYCSACDDCKESIGVTCRYYVDKIHRYFGIE